MRNYTLLIFLLCAYAPARADDAPAPLAAHWTITQNVLLFEGLATFNSAAAAASPQVTGGVILLTVPLAFAEDRSPLRQSIVAVSGYAAIGVYDAAYPKVYSRPRVFAENFVAWNLWGGAMLLMEHGDSSGSAAKLAQHVNVLPQSRGGVHVDLHWTF